MRKKSLIRLLVPTIALALLTTAVAAPAQADPSDPAAPSAEGTDDAAAGNMIALVDQGPGGNGRTGQKILFMKQNADWNTKAAVAWTLKIPAGWDGITDVKLRTDAKGGKLVLVTAGNGTVGAFPYRSQQPTWTGKVTANGDCPGTPNPHSIELIPAEYGGGYAVADTNGYVWRFAAGAETTTRCYKLASAHGLLYSGGRLWAVGKKGLVQYDIQPDSLSQYGGLITTTGFSGGHDLSPVYGEAGDQMWVSDTKHVYKFTKVGGGHPQSLVRVTGVIAGSRVKSVGNQRDGTVIETRPFTDRVGKGCAKDFQTHTVRLYTRNGTVLNKKIRNTSCVYKARPVLWDYF